MVGSHACLVQDQLNASSIIFCVYPLVRLSLLVREDRWVQVVRYFPVHLDFRVHLEFQTALEYLKR